MKYIQCPKCNAAMSQGFVPDYTHGGISVGSWHKGRPQKSFWLGTKTPSSDGIPIGAFRCSDCGYLEFYADHDFAAK